MKNKKTVVIPVWKTLSLGKTISYITATAAASSLMLVASADVVGDAFPLPLEAVGDYPSRIGLLALLWGGFATLKTAAKTKEVAEPLLVHGVLTPTLISVGASLIVTANGGDGGVIGAASANTLASSGLDYHSIQNSAGLFALLVASMINGDFVTKLSGWLMNRVPVSGNQGSDSCRSENTDVIASPALELEIEVTQLKPEEPKPVVKVSEYQRPTPVASGGCGMEIKLGDDDVGNDIYWQPNNTKVTMNAHFAALGKSGSGKTQSIKAILLQLMNSSSRLLNRGTPDVIVFDYKQDYIDDEFRTATGANVHRLLKLPYNPLALYGNTPMLPLHTANGFAETVTRAYNLGNKQKLRLEKAIIAAYEAAGIFPENESSWQRPAPTIADVWEVFANADEPPEHDSLYAALNTLNSFKIFESNQELVKPLYEMLDGITVIDLAGYSASVQNLIVGLTLDVFYAQMQRFGKPITDGSFRQITKMILVDEADGFMAQNFPALNKIMKQAREYGVSVMLSTQESSSFKTNENDYASQILTWVVHKVDKMSYQDVAGIFGVRGKGEQEDLMNSVSRLVTHKSIYVNGLKERANMNDLPFWKLNSK